MLHYKLSSLKPLYYFILFVPFRCIFHGNSHHHIEFISEADKAVKTRGNNTTMHIFQVIKNLFV